MKHYTPLKEIQDYYDSTSLSQSMLKYYMGSIEDVKKAKTPQEEYYEDKRHLIIGSAIDTLLTSENDFNSKYYIMDSALKKPSETEMAILKTLFDLLKLQNKSLLDHYEDLYMLQKAVDFHSFYMNRRKDNPEEDNRLKMFNNDIHINYWKSLVESEGKTIIDSDTYNLIILPGVSSITTSANTLKYFKNTKEVDIYYQLPLKSSIKNVEVKGLPDIIYIDHLTKEIQVIDIKTTSKPLAYFTEAVKQFRYDVQLSFYIDLLIKNFEFYYPELDISNYDIQGGWIVTSTLNPGTSKMFKAGEELLDIGRVGNEFVMGYKDALDKYILHKEANNYNEDICFFNNNIPVINWRTKLTNNLY